MKIDEQSLKENQADSQSLIMPQDTGGARWIFLSIGITLIVGGVAWILRQRLGR